MDIDNQDFVTRMEALDVLSTFPPTGVGRGIGERFAKAFVEARPVDREAVRSMARGASFAANLHLYRNFAFRDGDMTGWFAMAGRSLTDLAAEGNELSRLADASPPVDEDAQYAEEEEDRVAALEEGGWYGRTHRYVADSERWIYVRFGKVPRHGRSAFGLAGEDNEDGPDEWRAAMGNMTHEAGVCVLRAVRHTSVPDAYVLLPPDAGNALYGVGDFDAYLERIVPMSGDGERPVVLRLDGSPVTCLGRDRTLRLELGSDGEYMVDTAKPCEVHALTLAQVWASDTVSMGDFLGRRRLADRGREPASDPVVPTF